MCPHCHSERSKVTNTRYVAAGSMIRRHRECLECHTKYTTYEIVIPRRLRIIKSDGSLEAFDMNKLTQSIRKAFGKHEVDDEVLDKAGLVLRELVRLEKEAVLSHDVGSIVQRHLRTNPVAFVRYAALQRRYKTIEQIEELIAEARLYEKTGDGGNEGSSAGRLSHVA
jgi:transcriptional repressor NrdR